MVDGAVFNATRGPCARVGKTQWHVSSSVLVGTPLSSPSIGSIARHTSLDPLLLLTIGSCDVVHSMIHCFLPCLPLNNKVHPLFTRPAYQRGNGELLSPLQNAILKLHAVVGAIIPHAVCKYTSPLLVLIDWKCRDRRKTGSWRIWSNNDASCNYCSSFSDDPRS